MTRQRRKVSQVYVVAARIALIRRDNKVLLIKRSKKDGRDSGKWELPGGKINFGQLIPEELKREVGEETGLVITSKKAIEPLTVLDRVNELGRFSIEHYILAVYRCSEFTGEVELSRDMPVKEHEKYEWVSVRTALKNRRRLTADTRRALPYLLD